MAEQVLAIRITAEDAASGVMSGLKGAASGLGGVLQGALNIGLGVATAGFGALAAGAGLAIAEAMDAEKNLAQLDAVLKSTGGAAGVTRDQVTDLADALSLQSTFSDDAILQGENLLLTFTNIGKDVFPDATQALVDMAAAMGTDVKGGAIQLGKALNDPIAGIAALSRVGVTFDEDTKKVIKTMTEQGDVAGAQKIILAELNKEFGGSAAAQAQTFAGSIEVIKNQMLNLAEGVGTAALPLLKGFMDSVITPAIPILTNFATTLTTTITDFFAMLAAGESPLDAISTAMGNLFGPEAVAAMEPFRAAIEAIQPAFQNLVSAFAESMPMIQTQVGEAFTFVKDTILAVMPTIVENVTTALNGLAEFWRAHGETIMSAIRIAFSVIALTVTSTLTLVSGIIAAAMRLINGDWQGAWTTIKDTFRTIIESILRLVGTNLDSFLGTWRNVLFVQLPQIIGIGLDRAIAAARALVQGFIDLGRSLMDGLIGGIRDAAAGLAQAAIDAVLGAIQAAKDALGIKSPAKVTVAMGAALMQGLTQGIVANQSLPAAAFASSASLVIDVGGIAVSGARDPQSTARAVNDGIGNLAGDARIQAMIRQALAEHDQRRVDIIRLGSA